MHDDNAAIYDVVDTISWDKPTAEDSKDTGIDVNENEIMIKMKRWLYR